jgi:hypothetical protein
MALKTWQKWAIGGAIGAVALGAGIPRVLKTAWHALWDGVYGMATHTEHKNLTYNMGDDRILRMRYEAEGKGALENFLAMRKGACPRTVGLEIIAADAADGTADGTMTAENINKLAHGYFANQAKGYTDGNVPMKEIFGNAKPRFDPPLKPGEGKTE